MRVRVSKLFGLIGVGSVFVLGFLASRVVVTPLAGLGELLHNPFGISTSIAPTGPVVIEQIQRLNRLETCRYNGHVIVRGDTSGALPTWLVGDRILFVGRGEVVAGVNLAQLRPADVQVQEGKVSLHLPTPQIFHTNLDNRQSEVYERQTGLLSKPDMDLETKVRQQAEDQIREAAVADGVLKTAETNAREAVRSQLALLGLRDVNFV